MLFSHGEQDSSAGGTSTTREVCSVPLHMLHCQARSRVAKPRGVCPPVDMGPARTSVRMMSAAPLAAAVAPATAMPTLAFFSAGASFTPSPERSNTDRVDACAYLQFQTSSAVDQGQGLLAGQCTETVLQSNA